MDQDPIRPDRIFVSPIGSYAGACRIAGRLRNIIADTGRDLSAILRRPMSDAGVEFLFVGTWNGNPPRGARLVRVVFVSQSFSSFGGGELILERLMTQVRRSAEVTVIARSWPQPEHGPEFIRCDPPRIARMLRDGLFSSSVCRLVARQSGALVVAQERIPCCDIYRASEGVHAAYLEWRSRDLSAIARSALHASPFHRSKLRLERLLFDSPRLKAAVVNSAMVASDIERYYDVPRDLIQMVPNGIDLARFSPDAGDAHRDSVRRQLGVGDARPVALLVGSGYARKGLANAIRALSLSRTDAELWVVGKDSRPSAYGALAERAGVGQRLRLLGPQIDPVPFYGAADVLLLPSIYDPFPSTVVEALACGLPVVTSSGCGARDIVTRLDAGLVRDPFDVDGLAAALDRAFELAALPSTAPAARAIAEEHDLDRMVERLLALFGKLAPLAGQIRR